jgi:hypothetical protein
MAGSQDNNDKLPVLLTYGGGAGIAGGRVLEYKGKPERQLSRLFLSLKDKMGQRPERFGDANSKLDAV